MNRQLAFWNSETATQIVAKYANKRYAWPTAVIAVYVYAIRELRLGQPYAFGDYVPFVGMRAVGNFLSTWQYGLLGYKQTLTTYALYLGGLTTFGGATTHALIFIATLPAAFLAFRYFLTRFTKYEPARTLGGVVYAFNPITFSKFVNGGWNELITVIGIPLVATYLYAYVETDDRENLLYAAAVFGATTIVIWTAFWLILPIAFAVLIKAYPSRTKFQNLVATGFVAIVLTIPNMYYLLLRAEGLASPDQYFRFISFNYSQATFPLLLRLAGNKGGLAMLTYQYNTDPLFAVGFVIPIIGVLGLSNRQTWPYALATIVAAAFAVATRLELTYVLFRWFPPLLSLRNPNKLLYVIMFAEALMFAMGVNFIYDTFAEVKQTEWRLPVIRGVFIALLCLSLMVYMAPANGSFGVNDVREDGYFIPQEYEVVADDLDGRALWVPYTYTTQLRLRHTYPSHVGIRGGSPARANTDQVNSVFRGISRGKPVYQQLRSLGVTHVVVDAAPNGRFDSHHGAPRVEERRLTPWLYGSPSTLAKYFNSSDRYERTVSVGDLTVYRVQDVEATGLKSGTTGFHQVYYPNTTNSTVGVNKIRNSKFRHGTTHWWIARNSPTTVTPVVAPNGANALELETRSVPPSKGTPIAQEVAVTPGREYSVNVETMKNGSLNVFLLWYDGAKDPDNLVSTSKYASSELPTEVTAKGSTLSLRIKTATPTTTITGVYVFDRSRDRSFVSRGYSAASAGIPGVTVRGSKYNTSVGTTVAVNLPQERASEVGADVRVTDAETKIAGTIVYDDRYRQGMAVKTTGDVLRTTVPSNATIHAERTDDGVIVDYWQTGEFGSTPTTVIHQSYHPGWGATTDATHLQMQWQNVFVGASPSEVSWKGNPERPFVLGLWVAIWLSVLGAIGYQKFN